MKKLIVMMLCAVMAFSLVACSNSSKVEDTTEPKVGGETNVQIPNPIVDVDSLEAAAETAGFDITLPDNIPDGYSLDAIRVSKTGDAMIEIIYVNGDDEIRIRKTKTQDNVSGDYNEYNEANDITVGENAVHVCGNDGKTNIATWTAGEYSYSISAVTRTADFSIAGGLDNDTTIDLIKGIQ